MADNSTRITTDHGTIKKWADARDGKPAIVSDTEDDGKGIVKIKFRDNDDLKEIEWEAFFDNFEESELAMIYQEETSDGSSSNFNKLIDRNSKEAGELME